MCSLDWVQACRRQCAHLLPVLPAAQLVRPIVNRIQESP
jgi:hypothetical protein